jgi:hypothetical protein
MTMVAVLEVLVDVAEVLGCPVIVLGATSAMSSSE